MTFVFVIAVSAAVGLLLSWGVPEALSYLKSRPVRRIRKSRDREIAEINRMFRTAHEQIRDIGKDRTGWF